MVKTIQSVTPKYKLNLSWRCMRLSSAVLPFLKAKQDLENPCGVVYSWQCVCSSEYIRETPRNCRARLREHNRPSMRSNIHSHTQICNKFIAAVKNHSQKTVPNQSDKRKFSLTLYKILNKTKYDYFDRTLCEGIEISLRLPCLNDQVKHQYMKFLS